MFEYKGVSQDQAIKTAISIIRAPYAWPGCYEKIVVTDDGGVLCHQCVKENLREIALSTPGDGWRVTDVGSMANEEPGVICDHCGRLIGE